MILILDQVNLAHDEAHKQRPPIIDVTIESLSQSRAMTDITDEPHTIIYVEGRSLKILKTRHSKVVLNRIYPKGMLAQLVSWALKGER